MIPAAAPKTCAAMSGVLLMATGDLKASATLGYVLPADETPLGNMLTAGAQEILIQAANGITGTGALSLAVQMSAAQCTTASPDRRSSQIQYATAWGATANPADSGGTGGTSAAQVTLVNTVPAYGAGTAGAASSVYASVYAAAY